MIKLNAATRLRARFMGFRPETVASLKKVFLNAYENGFMGAKPGILSLNGCYRVMRAYQDYSAKEIETALKEAKVEVGIVQASVPNFRPFKTYLAALGKSYLSFIPIADICHAAQTFGIALVDEGGEPWEGVLTGRDGRCDIELAEFPSMDSLGKYLHLQWHKMPSGRYEINAYTD